MGTAKTSVLSRLVAHAAATLGIATIAACGGHEGGDTLEAGSRLALSVGALDLPDIVDVTYEIRVFNADEDLVWERTLSSSRFGNGRGDVSYVGPCDADASPNRVELVVRELYTATGPLDAATWRNPAPPGSPLPLTVPCVENADTPVTFNLTIVRSAQQGFFDVAVNFEDIFCSAKFDCATDAGPISLLFQPNGQRGPTMVMAFACTTGEGSPTWLWLDRVRITCANGESYSVDPALPEGNAGAYPPLLFQTGIYRGLEGFTEISKCYWNMAFGVDVAHLATILGGCRLEVTATATESFDAAGATPPGWVWPVISWDIPFSSNGTDILCEPPTNPLNGPGSNVVTDYTSPAGTAFDFGFGCGDSSITRINGRLCEGRAPGIASDVEVTADEDGVVVSLGGVSSPPYRLPATFGGRTPDGLATSGCCVDPCCAE